MPKALWNGTVIAEATPVHIEMVEGNVYFPASTVRQEFLRDSKKHTVCPWKGTASYYDVVVDGHTNQDAAWYYPAPKEKAAQIKDSVAFWRGVQIEA